MTGVAVGKETASPKWRTFIAMIITYGVLLGALIICLHQGEIGEKMLVTTSWSVVLVFTAIAGHNAVQHLSDKGGGGYRGVVSAFMGQTPPTTHAPAPAKTVQTGE